MRIGAAIIFILALLIAEFGATLVLIDFELDRERIIRELCIERDMLPEMQSCKGKCHLSKKLKEVTNGPDQPSEFFFFEYAGKPPTKSTLIDFPALREKALQFTNRECSGYARSTDPIPWRG